MLKFLLISLAYLFWLFESILIILTDEKKKKLKEWLLMKSSLLAIDPLTNQTF